MSKSIFYKYEKYWRKKKPGNINNSLEWFDIRCLAESLLTDAERRQMDEYVYIEEFLEILLEAAKKNDVEKLHETLQQNKLNLNFFGLDGFTPLLTVCKMGHNEIAQMLLHRGALVNLVDRQKGYSPLQLSAMYGHHVCVSTLLQNGADISYVNKETAGRNALHYACESGSLMSVRELLVSRELNLVKKNDALRVIQATLDVQDNDGHTPLHVAVIDGSAACARMLLEAGANSGIRDANKRTALMIASEMGNSELVSLLQPYSSSSEEPTAAAAAPSPSSSSSSAPTSPSIAVERERSLSDGGLFAGCTVVVPGSPSASTNGHRLCYVVLSGAFLVSEQDAVVASCSREIADLVCEQFSQQQARVRRDSVSKADLTGSRLNNNSNIFSGGGVSGSPLSSSGPGASPKAGGAGLSLGRWGRRPSLGSISEDKTEAAAAPRSSESGAVKTWSGDRVPCEVLQVDRVAVSSSGKSSAQVISVKLDKVLALQRRAVYESVNDMYVSGELGEGGSPGAASASAGRRFSGSGALRRLSEVLEEEDPMWEQYKQQNGQRVVKVVMSS